MKLDLISAVALTTLMGVDAAGSHGPFYTNPKPHSQDFLDNYNALKYTSWMGPWSQRRGVGLNRDPPDGCRIDQVALFHRHGERYPDKSSAVAMDKALAKLAPKKGHLKGSLQFVNEWEHFTSPTDGMIAQESIVGPYSGHLDGYARGLEYRRRYGHLYDGESTLPIFTSGYERITETGRKFGQGFLGFNYTDLGAVQIIPETKAQGADTLVPVCNLDTATTCDTNGNEAAKKARPGQLPWDYEEFQRAATRLNKENGLNLTSTDIPDLMSFAPFELNVRGSTPWLDVFTSEEWVAFEYLQSSLYYCYAGPGASNNQQRGSLYLNATRTLFNQGPEEVLPLYFSFAHDTDITPVVALLGFATPESFDPTQVHFNSLWDVADIVPQGGHLTLERLVCSNQDVGETEWSSEFPLAFNGTNTTATYASNATYAGAASNATKGSENIYVRVVLNEAVAPLPGCNSGPGKSCKLSEFNEFVDKAIDGADFVKTCNVSSSAPQYLNFFWDWNNTNANNYDHDPIPYQAGLLDPEGNPLTSS